MSMIKVMHTTVDAIAVEIKKDKLGAIICKDTVTLQRTTWRDDGELVSVTLTKNELRALAEYVRVSES